MQLQEFIFSLQMKTVDTWMKPSNYFGNISAIRSDISHDKNYNAQYGEENHKKK